MSSPRSQHAAELAAGGASPLSYPTTQHSSSSASTTVSHPSRLTASILSSERQHSRDGSQSSNTAPSITFSASTGGQPASSSSLDGRNASPSRGISSGNGSPLSASSALHNPSHTHSPALGFPAGRSSSIAHPTSSTRASFNLNSPGGLAGPHLSNLDLRPPLRGSFSEGMPIHQQHVSSQGSASSRQLAPPPLQSSVSSGGLPGSLPRRQSPALRPVQLSQSLSGSSSQQSAHGSPSAAATANLYGLQSNQPAISPMPTPANFSVPPTGSNDARTSLLVLNLPYKVRWQDLKDLFRRSNGTVLRTDVSLTPDGRSRCFGSVLMRDTEDALRAKECFDGFEWMGRRLEVMIESGGAGGWADASPSAGSAQAYPQRQGAGGQPSSSSAPYFPTKATGASAGAGPGRSEASYVNALSQIGLNPQTIVGGAGPALSAGGPALGGPSPLGGFSPSPHNRSSRSPAPPGGSMQNPTAPTPLRSSFSASPAPRPSSTHPPTSGMGSGNSSLPAPPFPPPMPSPMSNSTVPPGTIPTQHQIAVLSAQAAQAAVAAQQAKVVAVYGGMPDGSYYGRTLFVGNLSYATQWQDLKDLFRAAGNIVRADIALGPEGRSRGFGTALFGTKDEAARAVRMFHGYDHNGRTLKVHFDRFARMEAPPLGVLVPPRAEDYTSAFSAAQPPSNTPGASKTANSIGGAGGPSLYPQQGIYEHHHQHPQYQQSRHQQMPSFQQQQSYQTLPPPSSLQGGHQPMRQYNQRGGLGQSSYRPSQFAPQQQQHQYAQQQPSSGFVNPFGYQQQGSYGDFAALQNQQPPQTSSQLLGQPFDEESFSADRRASEASTTVPSSTDEQSAEENEEQDHFGMFNKAAVRPGRIALPPQTMPRNMTPFQQYYSNFSPVGARAPMPMTPGVPLTPGMPGFTFAGSMPPQTPPTFASSFMSSGGVLSPGGVMPPTPWQVPGMSAAPGAPGRMMGPAGQSTPRAGNNGAGPSSFNPFFAHVGGQGQYDAGSTRPPGQRRPQRKRTQTQQSQTHTAGDEDEAAASVDTAVDPSSSILADDTITAANEPTDSSALVTDDDAEGPPSTLALPANLPAMSAFTRRASTNSAAVSPGLFGPQGGPSFGYFGAAMAGTKTEAGTAGSSGYHHDGNRLAIAERDRRPSLDATALRTPMRDESLDSAGYFPSTGGLSNAEQQQRKIATGVADPTAASTSPSVSLGPSSAGTAGVGTPPIPVPAAAFAIAAGQTSTEELTRTIARMSVQGTALKRGNSHNQSSNASNAANGNASQSKESKDV